MAELIAPGAEPVHVAPQGRVFGLAEMYALIRCSMVQCVALADGRQMWLDEEGKFAEPPLARNDRATNLLHAAGGMSWDAVVGTVLITEPGEVD